MLKIIQMVSYCDDKLCVCLKTIHTLTVNVNLIT
jgi:hypothetical protein